MGRMERGRQEGRKERSEEAVTLRLNTLNNTLNNTLPVCGIQLSLGIGIMDQMENVEQVTHVLSHGAKKHC